MKRTLTWMLLLGVLAITAAGFRLRPDHQFALAPESQLWIEGSSSVNTFTCEAAAVEGVLVHQAAATAWQPGQTHNAQAMLDIPVREIDCGQRRMERDLQTVLQADTYPEIRYELTDIEVLETPRSGDGVYELRAAGRMTVAGTTRPVETTVRGWRLADGRLRATGSQQLMMSDFGIDPPTALFGLIRASDHLVVRFDLVAVPQPTPVAGGVLLRAP